VLRTDSIRLNAHAGERQIAAAKNAPVYKLPPHYSGPIVTGVFDMTLKEENGRISKGQYIKLNGSAIELQGPLAALEFVPISGAASVKADLIKVLVNKPSEVILLVPANAPLGGCLIRLTTQYLSNGKLLKTPHTVTFNTQLTIV
jgi:hypothetical protein